MKPYKRAVALLLALCTLLTPVLCASAESDTAAPENAEAETAAPETVGPDFSGGLEAPLLDYIAKHNLDETNFGLGFYDTATGTTYYYCENEFRRAASMYKLPLNMIYTDWLAEGRRSLDDWVNGWNLDTAMHYSMVYSSNETSLALVNGMLPDFGYDWNAAWGALARYSDLDADELPGSFVRENCMSPHLLLETLKVLYTNSEHYATVLERMKQANAGHYLRFLYDDRYVIAQKYGALPEGNVNVAAVVYTPRPFLLVVFTRYALPSGEQVLSDLRELCIQYAQYLQETNPNPVVMTARQQLLGNVRSLVARLRLSQ